MARYTVNERGVAHVRKLIEARQYVLNSDWGEVQPRAEDENAYLKRHSWEDYGSWFLGLTDGASEDTKGRYAFVFGDFRRVHRSGDHRLPLPGGRMAAQGGRTGGTRPLAAAGQEERPDQIGPLTGSSTCTTMRLFPCWSTSMPMSSIMPVRPRRSLRRIRSCLLTVIVQSEVIGT